MCIGYEKSLWPSVLGRGPLLGLPAAPPTRAYMREIGAMWQLRVLTGKPCTFGVQNGSFSAFWHYENKERLLKNGTFLLLVLLAPESGFLLEFVAQTGLPSAMARAPKPPQNGENVHGFQVRTPICHIVPVSRTYPPRPILGHPFWGFPPLPGTPFVRLWDTWAFSPNYTI